MKEKNENPSNHLTGRLPVHQPDASIWAGISSSLDQLEKEDAYKTCLANLPQHRADANTWGLILRRMQWTSGLRKGAFATLAAAATILLLISIFRPPETSLQTGTGNLAASDDKQLKKEAKQLNLLPGPAITNESNLNQTERNPSANLLISNSGIQRQSPQLTETNLQESVIPLTKIRNTLVAGISPLEPRLFSFTSTANLSRKQQPVHPAFLLSEVVENKKYYTVEPGPQGKKKGSQFTLAANYLPESLNNGNGNSLFHNVGLTASLGNEKTRLQSSLGMAYNSEHRVYDVDYTQFITITVPNPGSQQDSTIVVSSERQSELEGIERHQYITYDLGLGKRLFTLGKMTTWLNTGAGFAVKLDHSSLKETTIKTFNAHNNALVNEMNLEIPDYNGVNINLMAGLDFNYKLMKRLSFSFAPVSRLYLKPVLVKNGLPTDSFSLGFRTGMKYDF